MPLSEDVRRRVIERFNRTLPAKTATIIEVMRNLRSGAEGAEEIARRLAHQLRGAGGSFGWPEITEAAAEAETSSREFLDESLGRLLTVVGGAAASARESNDPRRVLLCGADEATMTHVQVALEAQGIEVEYTAGKAAAWARVTEQTFDLLILDLVLSDGDGRWLLGEMRAVERFASLPAIVLSSWRGSGIKTECYALGVEQYIEKPADVPLLCTVVAGILTRRERQDQLVKTDALTGLCNRAGFGEAFVRNQASRIRRPAPAALSLIDLDNFKALNDQLGHVQGDRALRRLARVLASTLRASDVIGRYGGDEILVLFPENDAQEGARALERVRAELRRDVDGPDFTISAGVIDVPTDADLDAATALADAQLYAAKRAGRNRIALENAGADREERRVLLAEDDEVMAEAVTELLAEGGLTVDHVPDGNAAFRSALAGSFELVILDHEMPGRSGFSVLEELRANRSTRRLPILMLTSIGCEEHVARAFDLGADDYLQKPFRPRELLARVRRLARQ